MRAKTLLESFRFAFLGLVYSYRTQRNFRIHCWLAILLGLLCVFVNFALWEVLFLFSAAFAVMISELINTSIEKTIDLYTKNFHPLAKVAKNCAAASVLMAALYAVLVGIIILVPKLLGIIGR